MRENDEIDREILRHLIADSRQPYSAIAEAVDLSAPAVRDRIDRLKELGVIRRFTIDIDRSRIREGVPLFLELEVDPDRVREVQSALVDTDGIEHVFTTADARVLCQGVFPEDVRSFLAASIDLTAVTAYDVSLLADSEWRPEVGGVSLALECTECGNTVTAEGESAVLGGEQYHFCCTSCQSRFTQRYHDLEEGA